MQLSLLFHYVFIAHCEYVVIVLLYNYWCWVSRKLSDVARNRQVWTSNPHPPFPVYWSSILSLRSQGQGLTWEKRVDSLSWNEKKKLKHMRYFKEGMNNISSQMFLNSRKLESKRLSAERMGLILGLDKRRKTGIQHSFFSRHLKEHWCSLLNKLSMPQEWHLAILMKQMRKLSSLHFKHHIWKNKLCTALSSSGTDRE